MSSKLNHSKTTNRIDPQVKIAALVFAGGRGERMGRVDKALMENEGRALIDIVTEKLREECDQIYISRQADQADLSQFGEVVIDEDVDQGPLCGLISACKQAARDGFDYLVAVPVDTNALPERIIERLYNVRKPHAVAFQYGDMIPTIVLADLCNIGALTTKYESGFRSLRCWIEAESHGRVEINEELMENFNKLVKPL